MAWLHMSKTCWSTATRTLLVAVATVALFSCSDDADTDAGTVEDGSTADAPLCSQPPTIYDCEPPPNQFSDTRWYCRCYGYCFGPTPAHACDEFTNDCRTFYDGCIPETYTRCDQSASDRILGLCGMCFFTEAGVLEDSPPECHHIYLDAGNGSDAPPPASDASAQ
jgi:hypothetical protein